METQFEQYVTKAEQHLKKADEHSAKAEIIASEINESYKKKEALNFLSGLFQIPIRILKGDY